MNDMATVNIDKSLLDESAVVENDQVIALQNGCICCTLQTDLVKQVLIVQPYCNSAQNDHWLTNPNFTVLYIQELYLLTFHF